MKFDSSREDISSSPSRESESNKIDDRGPPKTKSDNTEFLRTFSADENDSVGNESKAVKWEKSVHPFRGSRTIRTNINWATSRFVISDVNDPFANFFTPNLPRIFDTNDFSIVRQKFNSTAVFTKKISGAMRYY